MKIRLLNRNYIPTGSLYWLDRKHLDGIFAKPTPWWQRPPKFFEAPTRLEVQQQTMYVTIKEAIKELFE